MEVIDYVEALRWQRCLSRRFAALLRLSEMQLRATTPDIWQRLLELKQSQVELLQGSDLARLTDACQRLIPLLPPREAHSLRSLMEANLEALTRLCQSEARATARAAEVCERRHAQLLALNAGRKLRRAYAASWPRSPRFLDQVR